jgi:hypothetical protein
MPTLREEFEPHLLSPDGLHASAEDCRKAWDAETSTDARLAKMIGLADQWLRECTKSSAINRRAPSSFMLSKIASRWFGRDGFGPRILHGCFLMSAHRAGFKMQPAPPRYVDKIKRNASEAFISIGSWPRIDGAPGQNEKRKEARL